MIDRTHFTLNASRYTWESLPMESLLHFLSTNCPRLHSMDLRDCIKLTEFPRLSSGLRSVGTHQIKYLKFILLLMLIMFKYRPYWLHQLAGCGPPGFAFNDAGAEFDRLCLSDKRSGSVPPAGVRGAQLERLFQHHWYLILLTNKQTGN